MNETPADSGKQPETLPPEIEPEGEHFRLYFELGLIVMAITSPTKGILEINDYICEILGYERSELLQTTWTALTHPDDLAADIANFNRVLAGEIEGYVMDKRWIRKDNQVIHTTISVKCIRNADGTVACFVALMQDITERKEAEAALRRVHDELEVKVTERTRELAEANHILQAEIAERKQAQRLQQHLLLQLDSAQENERRRIARELHDSLGQYLTALDIGLKSVQEMEGCTDAVAGSLQRLRVLAMSIDDNVDRLAFELHPRELDDFGLEDTLRRHVQQWSIASGIAVSTHFRGLDHDHLSTFVETTVYRIIQEAMTNILRHAGAMRVSLIVERRGTEILAIIEDDGRGFDVEAMQGEQRRLGFQGMKERAALANGMIDIESEPGTGTTVYLHVPIPTDRQLI